MNQQICKDSFYTKISFNNVSGASLLPAGCADMIGGSLQKPVNPHAQRLLAASKRTAKVETAGPAKEPRAKGKAKAQPKKKPAAAKVPKVTAAEVKEKAKNDYMTAKNAFMDECLGNHNIK